MHLHVFVEDSSGGDLLEIILEKIIGTNGADHSWKIYSYRGLGKKLPTGLRPGSDPARRILLDQLPRIVNGVASTMRQTGEDYPQAAIFVVDLDNRDCMEFKQVLVQIGSDIFPTPPIFFRIAIEEIEAWLLGDSEAIMAAFPQANRRTLQNYTQDSICGTWETLADVVHPGGAVKLKDAHFYEIGRLKSEWAIEIGAHMNPGQNLSPSFGVFYRLLEQLLSGER